MADRDAPPPKGPPERVDVLGEVVSSLTAPHGSPTLDAAPRADPTADALAVVGAALDHPAIDPIDSDTLTLEQGTSAASGWMSWRVRLTGRWFDNLSVPLLVRKDAAPAAIVPDGTRSLIIDGGTRATRRLRRREAEELEPEAVAFAVDLDELHCRHVHGHEAVGRRLVELWRALLEVDFFHFRSLRPDGR